MQRLVGRKFFWRVKDEGLLLSESFRFGADINHGKTSISSEKRSRRRIISVGSTFGLGIKGMLKDCRSFDTPNSNIFISQQFQLRKLSPFTW